MKRILMGIEYDGTRFHGFQAQERLLTVQGELERAISLVADEPVTVFCAGRTDKGVHARGQVIHFDTNADRSDYGWLMGVNSHLPPDIAVQWVKEAEPDFHARYQAKSRRYIYTIINTPARSALEHRFATWVHRPLDADKMHEAAQCLLGQHDFSAFRAAECQAKNPVKTVHWANVSRESTNIILDIQADAFLHHMVRNIMGSLILIGQGREPVSFLKTALDSCDRKQAGPTAPPNGLCLFEVGY